MITMEELITGPGENTDILADSIIALMKRAYESGYESGYVAGCKDRKGLLMDDELDAAFTDGQQEGYARGLEDGYDEACMDLTDDDPGSSLHEEEMTATGCQWG